MQCGDRTFWIVNPRLLVVICFIWICLGVCILWAAYDISENNITDAEKIRERTQMNLLEIAVLRYSVANRKWPASLDVLTKKEGVYLENAGDLVDPWGIPYIWTETPYGLAVGNRQRNR